jgi:hypothetical protein
MKISPHKIQATRTMCVCCPKAVLDTQHDYMNIHKSPELFPHLKKVVFSKDKRKMYTAKLNETATSAFLARKQLRLKILRLVFVLLFFLNGK